MLPIRMKNVNSSMYWDDFWREEEGPPIRLVLHIGRTYDSASFEAAILMGNHSCNRSMVVHAKSKHGRPNIHPTETGKPGHKRSNLTIHV
jgi:hypothetical protein